MDKSLLTVSESVADSENTESAEALDKAPRKKRHWRITVALCIYLLVIPTVILIGVKLFFDRKYNIVSIVIAFLACVPFL